MAFTSLTAGQTDADSPLDQALMDLIRLNLDDLDDRASGQVVNTQTATEAQGTTNFVNDDTTPQNTELDQYMTLAITPNSATSNLKIDVTVSWSDGNAGENLFCLFQDASADAICSVPQYAGIATALMTTTFSFYTPSVSTTARTYKLYAASLGGTFYFNQAGTIDKFNGTMFSSITITEIP